MALSPRILLNYAITAICITYVIYPSALPGVVPLFVWAMLLAIVCSLAYYAIPTWTFMILVVASLFSIHTTRRYIMFLKQPVSIFDLTQYSEAGSVAPTSRTQSVFDPAPPLSRADRKSYLESLKYAPKRLGGNNFREEVTLEETIINQMTPLGKSYLLPVGTVPSVPGLFLK